ncbi:penicillin-binding protein activator [Entomomonas moraniae]|uniref:Penicillin-binding protein activator n=1 Tax=Entomomonas moraniae TaxID=2213226 RepID=A0A3Q9JIR1_9GAMM|nr:penicillin-binding protein activator [Entomomonas moraniae]AZS50557.1 penicillin-binding protein activator [Entomomonas moraniae]
MKVYLRLLALFLFAFLLTACDILSLNNNNQMPSFTNTQGNPTQLINLANQQSNVEIANQYRLIAADKYIQAKQEAKAQEILKELPANLTNTQQMIVALLNANIALNKKDTTTALSLLTGKTFYQLDEQDPDLQVRVRLLKASAFELEGKPLQALRERSYISSFLKGNTAQDNQDNIWRLAMSVPLDALLSAADSGETGGWLELAKAVKTASTVTEQKQNIENWIAANPNHPAVINPPAELLTIKGLTTETYSKIAVLLPQKQKYAQAIYNGFIAAYYQAPNKDKVTIKAYESTDYPTMDAFYAQAQKDGIQLVVGPLDKAQINELSKKSTLPITTLALNYTDTNTQPPQLFQFGLLPEDEAREAATRAFNDGKRHAIAVVPQGEWGKKVLSAFRSKWEEQGGVLEGIEYIDRPVDLDGQMVALTKKLPNLKEANDNMLFMVADPAMARQIRALLTYHDEKDLPVYATSHIYSGVPSANQDADLNGVLFTDVPWLLSDNNPVQQAIVAQWPQAKTSFARLYALGADTWSLIPRLSELKALPNSRIEGLSGELSIDSQQRVVRKLPWATFDKGLIQPAPAISL